jgi:hypothetical protein
MAVTVLREGYEKFLFYRAKRTLPSVAQERIQGCVGLAGRMIRRCFPFPHAIALAEKDCGTTVCCS